MDFGYLNIVFPAINRLVISIHTLPSKAGGIGLVHKFNGNRIVESMDKLFFWGIRYISPLFYYRKMKFPVNTPNFQSTEYHLI
jgi:hypothetical protein